MYAFRRHVSRTFDRNSFCVKVFFRLDFTLKMSLYSQSIGLVCKVQLVVGLAVVLQCLYCRVAFMCFQDVEFLLSRLYDPL